MLGDDSLAHLPKDHRSALFDAASALTDAFYDDVVALDTCRIPFENTTMAGYIPRKYVARYDLLFARKFLVCLVTATWMLFGPELHKLTCVAEELALMAIIKRAEDFLEASSKEADFNGLMDEAFEDTDFLLLFDASSDGSNDRSGDPGAISFPFEDWFKPFYEDTPVHPYVTPV